MGTILRKVYAIQVPDGRFYNGCKKCPCRQITVTSDIVGSYMDDEFPDVSTYAFVSDTECYWFDAPSPQFEMYDEALDTLDTCVAKGLLPIGSKILEGFMYFGNNHELVPKSAIEMIKDTLNIAIERSKDQVAEIDQLKAELDLIRFKFSEMQKRYGDYTL